MDEFCVPHADPRPNPKGSMSSLSWSNKRQTDNSKHYLKNLDPENDHKGYRRSFLYFTSWKTSGGELLNLAKKDSRVAPARHYRAFLLAVVEDTVAFLLHL
jgi:hypothetical protein